MTFSKLILIGCLLMSQPLGAQQINLPEVLAKLSPLATETVEVNLDASMLKFASGFLTSKKGEEAAAKKLIEGLKGVYVRSFEFDRDGVYSPSDLEPIREQLKSPQWVRIVTVREKGDKEEVGVWLYRENENTTGMVVFVTAPREVTFVNLVGPIRPEDLTTLGGQFGIPSIGTKENKDKKD